MIRLKEIRKHIYVTGVVTTMVGALGFSLENLSAEELTTPSKTSIVAASLEASQWQQLETGLQAIKAMTESGVALTAFKISPENFTFSIALQDDASGSRAKTVGEQQGAVVIANAGFFATKDDGELYSVGYLRLNTNVISKGWPSSGGVLSLKEDGLQLTPSQDGLPEGEFDVLQSKPMLIEPNGKWAMGSNAGSAKPRTILCTLSNGDVILATVTRAGLTLFEAGWLMRSKAEGGFFGCDAALAFDGGRSTQMWYSGDEKYSSNGISPVHNFFVVRQKED